MKYWPLFLLASCAVDTDREPDTSQDTQALNGDSWQTVDDDQYVGGKSAEFAGIAISPVTHKIFVVGRRGETNNHFTWMVRGMALGASGFGLNSTFVLATNHDSEATAITVDSLGYFYVTGDAFDASGKRHWIVRRTTDEGAHWSTVYDVQSGVDMQPHAITVDAAGTVYAVGKIEDSNAVDKAVILRGANHGTSWSTVYSAASPAPGETELRGACIGRYNGQPAVFANGYAEFATGQYEIAEVSTDGGTNWITALTTGGTGLYMGTGCAGTATGDDVYFASMNWDTSGGLYRVLDFKFTPFSSTEDDVISGYGAFAEGAIFAADRGYDFGSVAGTNNWNWRVRFTADGGVTWLDSDNWHTAGGSNVQTTAYAAAYDTLRGLYVVGSAEDANGRFHGIVRRRD